MDLIKLISSTGEVTEPSSAQMINGYEKVLWVERYQEPGEVKIEARLSSGLREFLPIGCLIANMASQEIMMIENHEIDQPIDGDPTLAITGRTLVAFMENRFVGDWYAIANRDIPEYNIGAKESWEQAVDLIRVHFEDGVGVDPNDALLNVYTYHACTGTPVEENRVIKYGDVLSRVQELLKVDNTGLKTLRPTATDQFIYWVIYQGEDKTDSVRFSWTGGDLINLRYLFSNKKLKNRVRVMGRWVQCIHGTSQDHYDRRTMLLDASDLDQQLSAMPGPGATLTSITNKMVVRAREAMRRQTSVAITQADVNPTSRWIFRRDYNLGDFVTVEGDFGAEAVMQVTEYAETFDETGTSGHPTLTIPGEDAT